MSPEQIIANHNAAIDELLARALCLIMCENPDATASHDIKPLWWMKLTNPRGKQMIAAARRELEGN